MNKNIIEILKKELGQGRVLSVSENALHSTFIYETKQQKYFIKIRPNGKFESEAKGLIEILNTKTIQVPKPIVWDDNFIALEYVDLYPHSQKSMKALGTNLALLHQSERSHAFGFSFDNTIGTTPQINSWRDQWATFFIEERLQFQLNLIKEKYGDEELFLKSQPFLKTFSSLLTQVPVTSALLHGDLWHGNTGQSKNGEPIVFDPAPYFGHNEAEFGIIEMFGGFDKSFYSAYFKVYPKEHGFDERVKGYQLYHTLNHYYIFGSSYRTSCMEIISSPLSP
ncbi:MAG: fructosamine kinase family protein [Candidatus Paceibacterota bacterium]